jgi:hypothetical protein
LSLWSAVTLLNYRASHLKIMILIVTVARTTYFDMPLLIRRGYRVARLRHCVTSQKVTGSILNGVIGIFY